MCPFSVIFSAGSSIRDGEPRPAMPGPFGLVERGDREILHRDHRGAIHVEEKLVVAEPVLAGALTGLKQRGWLR